VLSLPAAGLVCLTSLVPLLQDEPSEAPGAAASLESGPGGPSGRVVDWTEGGTIAVRVPVAAAGRELMTAISFPEESLETAITGLQDGETSAIQKRGLLFLRMTKRSEALLNVIGASGTHYLLLLKGVASEEAGSYDSYLKIRKKDLPGGSHEIPKRPRRRPSGAVELLQAMRLGLRTEGVKILRAKRELALESPLVEIRLLTVYDGSSYQGFIYEVKNRTDERQAVDASALRGKGTSLVLTALRENVIPPQGTTRLYAVRWKD